MRPGQLSLPAMRTSSVTARTKPGWSKERATDQSPVPRMVAVHRSAPGWQRSTAMVFRLGERVRIRLTPVAVGFSGSRLESITARTAPLAKSTPRTAGAKPASALVPVTTTMLPRRTPVSTLPGIVVRFRVAPSARDTLRSVDVALLPRPSCSTTTRTSIPATIGTEPGGSAIMDVPSRVPATNRTRPSASLSSCVYQTRFWSPGGSGEAPGVACVEEGAALGDAVTPGSVAGGAVEAPGPATQPIAPRATRATPNSRTAITLGPPPETDPCRRLGFGERPRSVACDG